MTVPSSRKPRDQAAAHPRPARRFVALAATAALVGVLAACGPVIGPVPPDIVSFTATPDEAQAPDEPVTLLWEFRSAETGTVEIQPLVGTVPDASGHGSVQVKTPHALEFTLTVTNRWGVRTRRVQVTVHGSSTPPQVAYFGSPPPVPQGTPSVFGYSAWDADDSLLTCTLDADGDAIPDVTINDCAGEGTVPYVYPQAGTYRPQFIVSDPHGGSAVDVEVTSVQSATGAAQ